MDAVTSVGRRERKKAATRATILAAAQELFLARGFDEVSVREVADRADVSPTTVFAHFAQKEALAFGDAGERERALIRAVVGRAAHQSISDALRVHLLDEVRDLRSGRQRRFLEMMQRAPSLAAYAERVWLHRERALADAIASDLGMSEPDDETRFFARFALQIQLGAIQALDPESLFDRGFCLLEHGWRNQGDRDPST